MIELLLWLVFYVAYTQAREARSPAPVAITASAPPITQEEYP